MQADEETWLGWMQADEETWLGWMQADEEMRLGWKKLFCETCKMFFISIVLWLLHSADSHMLGDKRFPPVLSTPVSFPAADCCSGLVYMGDRVGCQPCAHRGKKVPRPGFCS